MKRSVKALSITALVAITGVVVTTATLAMAGRHKSVNSCAEHAARKEAFRNASEAQKVAVFRHHIRSMEMVSTEWTPAQREVFAEAYAHLKPGLYSASPADIVPIAAAFHEKALRAWGGELQEVIRIFGTLNDDDLTSVGVPLADAGPLMESNKCNCMNSYEDCGSGKCYDWYPPTCEQTSFGCGTWWLFACTALCHDV